MYDKHVDCMYVLPIENLGSIITNTLINLGYENSAIYRDRVIYTILTEILKNELGYNLISINNYNKHEPINIDISNDIKIWKDYLWERIIDVVTVDLNLLYYVDILVNKGNVYIKLEENV